MKKIYLLTSLALFTLCANAQIIFNVQTPAIFSGNQDFMIAAATGWGIPDMTDPINSVVDTLAFVNDGTAADSLACANSVGSEVNGKIAVLYRGACEFGLKALNAQNAGAVAVIIINNVGTPSITPGGGVEGPNVTIPVIMIDSALGALFKDSINNGNMVAYIGTQYGYFNDDLGFQNNHVMRAKNFTNTSSISQNASQFEVELGAWVYNFGVNDQTGVTLTANINLAGSSIYTNGSAPVSILSNDSAYISLPTFSQASYANGYYTLNYDLTASVTDEFPADNTVSTNFVVNDTMYSYGGLDTTLAPIVTGGSRLSGGTGSFTACISFKNANTSTVGLFPTGMTFAAMTNATDDLIGKYMQLTLYEWGDVFTDINDAALTSLNGVAFGEYVYLNDDQYTPVYAELFPQVALLDNQWYLGCVTATDAAVFIGYDNDIDYQLNSTTYKMPMFPVGETAPTQLAFGGGSGEAGFTTQAPAIVMHMQTGVGINETEVVNITPYPNPTSDYISIPFGKLEGDATITILDMSGKIVKTVSVSMLSNDVTKINVSNLPSGMYVFHTELESGSVANFNVVINK
jgi:hypothetical protein